MLQGRLTTFAAAATLLAAACSGSGGAIEQNVVRPGITAIQEDAPAATCSVNASTVRSAVDSYTLLEGAPPVNEQVLVDEGYLRSLTTDWDVVDGEIVPENPACGPVPEATVATLDIVTETEPLDADEYYATLGPEQIDSVGGEACARELASIVAAAERYVVEQGAEPLAIGDLVDSGYLESTPELWMLDQDELVATDGSGCVGFG